MRGVSTSFWPVSTYIFYYLGVLHLLAGVLCLENADEVPAEVGLVRGEPLPLAHADGGGLLGHRNVHLGEEFVHKIEKLNAFIACANPGAAHFPAFMICRSCDSVAETQSMPARGALGDAAKAAGFVIERTVVEAEGLCPTCVDKDDT